MTRLLMRYYPWEGGPSFRHDVVSVKRSATSSKPNSGEYLTESVVFVSEQPGDIVATHCRHNIGIVNLFSLSVARTQQMK